MSDSTDFILGPQLATGDYFDTTLIAKARQHGEALPDSPPADTDAVTINSGGIGATFNNHFYYDLPRTLYTAHRRTGDPTFLAMADHAADLWFDHPTWIGGGKIRLLPDSATPSPRHAGIGGLCERAKTRPIMWDWINQYTRMSFDNWVKIRVNNPQLYYGVREGALSLQYVIWLSQVLPDSFPLQAGGTITHGAELRARFLADAEIACKQYFGRLQQPDGSWRWDTAPGETQVDGGDYLVGIMQPFQIGLLLLAECSVHAVTQNTTVKEDIKNQILRGCRHLYSDGPYIKDEIEQNSGKRIRGFHYFFHGGTNLNPTRYEKGDIQFPWTAAEAWWLPSTRQAISTILGAFGYAYQISGDPFFRDAGNEMYDAAYGGSDGVRAMMDDTAKNYNQHVLGSSSYKAWLGGEAQPPPLPPPTIPVLDESPDGFKGVRIVDSERAVWTIGPPPQMLTLRGGVPIGAGAGSIYKYLNKTVYVLGTDSNWYKWTATGWARFGAQEPGTTAPPPEPPSPPLPPAPPIPPQPPQLPVTRTVSWPKQASKQNPILNAQWAEKFRLKSVSDTSAVFEKVQ